MMLYALLALGFGAVAGIFLAARHFLRKPLPASVALLHGLGGATGFAFVLYTVVSEPDFQPIRDVLYLLIATVVLGVVNLLFHIRKVRHRTSLILMHGLTAVTSAAMLIRAIVVHVEPSQAAVPPAPSASAAPPAPSLAEPAPSAVASAAPAEPAPSEAAPAEKPAAQGDTLDDATKRAFEQTISFDTKSATMSSDSSSRIAEIAGVLKNHPEITLVQVQGHADERGEDARNIALTQARAAAVVNELALQGVARTRLHSAGFGSRCPANPDCAKADAPESCHDSSNWDRDRRVSFVVLQVGKTPFKGQVACERGAALIPAGDRRFHSP
jgi:outer membrane protein OmpA-like peptidoglycan-associated protein